MLQEDNSEVFDEGFYFKQNVEKNGLNKRSKKFQYQKSQKYFPKVNKKNKNEGWVVKTTKPNVEYEKVMSCNNSVPNDLNYQKAKTQSFKNGDKKSISKEEISKKKARNKAYWKKRRDFEKERKLQEKSPQAQEKKFSLKI